jgi:hypothetical protein
MALLAPVEALGWWAGWRKRAADAKDVARPGAESGVSARAAHEEYVVYLSGIGKASGRWSFPEEADFVTRLRAGCPDAAVIDDIFPYALTFRGLEEERIFKPLWSSVTRRLLDDPSSLVGWLINLRNVFQVAVSIDHRYGPFFNLGAAEGIREALCDRGYVIGSRQRVVLIGYSGGAQVSLGAATFLAQMLNAPIVLISVGGAMSSDPGCRWVAHIYRLLGDDDGIDRVSSIAFAGRWPLMKRSDWNWAVAQGKVTAIPIGPVRHNGPRGYFGPEPLPDGVPRVVRTVETVSRIIRESRVAL